MTIFQGKDGILRISDNHQITKKYVTVHFRNMDFSSQLGRPALEERLVLDTGHVNTFSHYVTGNDMVVFDPFGLSFSFMVDDEAYMGLYDNVIYYALQCRNATNGMPDSNWNGYGKSTKGTTQNKTGIDNPLFRNKIGKSPLHSGAVDSATNTGGTTSITATFVSIDNQFADCIFKFTSGTLIDQEFLVKWSEPQAGTDTVYNLESDVLSDVSPGDTFEVWDNYRTVDIQFKLDNGFGTPIVWKFNEVYFPGDEIALAESEENLTITATGGVYGTVQRSTDWIL